MAEAPYWAEWIGATLRAIPGPTDGWADIVSAIAWPALVGYLITRYRVFVRSYLATLADRLQRDNLKIGPFEMTPNSEVIPLDPEEASESTEPYAAGDIKVIEWLFEFIAEPDGFDKVAKWLVAQYPSMIMSDFLTEPEYAAIREEAAKAIMAEG